jgi:hypothetical protein
VVNHETELPTGYESEEMHPELRSNPAVLRSGADLETWLRDHDTPKRP